MPTDLEIQNKPLESGGGKPNSQKTAAVEPSIFIAIGRPPRRAAISRCTASAISANFPDTISVSYTHLTLPTTCTV